MNIDRDSKYRSSSGAHAWRGLGLLAPLLLSLGCATAPQRMSLYTPFPRAEVWQSVQRRVTELGYTATKVDSAGGVLVAQRASGNSADNEKQELDIRLSPDGTGTLKLEVVAARVFLAADGSVAKRSAARGETTSDASEILAIFFKKMK